MPQHEDPPSLPTESNDESDSEFSSESDDSDEELAQIRAAIAPASLDASPQELRKALEESQKLLLNLRGRYCEAMKRNALLEAAAPKGRKRRNLTQNELALAAKEDTIRTFGRKYSITHCLWVNVNIFPLRTSPDIDLNSKERWLSGLSIEDGVKAELFQFIPEEDRELMSYQSFGSQFGRGVSNARSEMVSDVKSCAGAIFNLNSNIFIRGYKRNEDPDCRSLLLSPHGEYTKFAPVLFPKPQTPSPKDLFKSATLVQILKVSLFGKSSLTSTGTASSRTKARIWKLRSTTAGLIAAAAVIVIFLLSGDAELSESGETTKIPYREYHNFYHQRILTGGHWSQQVLTFFNNALFSGTSSYAPISATLDDEGLRPGNMWEEDFERAMEQGLDSLPMPHAQADHTSVQSEPLSESDSGDEDHLPAARYPTAASTASHVAAPPVAAPATPAPTVAVPSESISSAMGDLNLGHPNARVGLEHVAANAQPKPKPRRKAGKTTDATTAAAEGNAAQAENSIGSTNNTIRRSRRTKQ